MIDRAEVERLAGIAANAKLDDAAVRIDPGKLAAICRMALEVMDAPDTLLTAGDDPETNEPCSEILGTFPVEWAGQPVRLVRVGRNR